MVTYGVPKDRTSKTLRSANKATVKISNIDNGVKVVYNFKDCGAKIPIEYSYARIISIVRVDVENIEEEDISSATGSLLTSISVFNSFGAALDDEEAASLYRTEAARLLISIMERLPQKAICQRFTDQIYQPFLKQSRP